MEKSKEALNAIPYTTYPVSQKRAKEQVNS
jgi:hypothetical protein